MLAGTLSEKHCGFVDVFGFFGSSIQKQRCQGFLHVLALHIFIRLQLPLF